MLYEQSDLCLTLAGFSEKQGLLASSVPLPPADAEALGWGPMGGEEVCPGDTALDGCISEKKLLIC